MRQSFQFKLMRASRQQHQHRLVKVAAHIWNHSIALHKTYYRLYRKHLAKARLQAHLAKLKRTRFPHWAAPAAQQIWLAGGLRAGDFSCVRRTRRTNKQNMELLVLVHPGSLCGSFAFNGGTEAELKALLAEVAAWPGVIVTIDNDLTDEVDGDRAVRRAYDRAEANYEAGGWEDELSAAAAELATDYGKRVTRVLLTGAWAGQDGCVTCVADKLKGLLACPVVISEFAARDFGGGAEVRSELP